MNKQLDVLNSFRTNLKFNKYIDWNTTSKNHNNVFPNKINSSGGTDPNCFLKFWNNESFSMIFTDGQIDISTMNEFRKNLSEKGCEIPIIIVFTIGSYNNANVSNLQNNINMSIPEAFLSLSNNVLIIISDGITPRILMSKGDFSEYYPNQELTPETNITSLKQFDIKIIDKVIMEEGVPSNFVKISNVTDEYFDLNNLSNINSIDDIDLLEYLCSRTILPRLNLTILHTTLDNLIKQCSVNKELDKIRDDLYRIATDPNMAGSEEHKKLIALYNQTKSNSKNQINKTLLNRIHKLKQIINEYQRDSTSFTYGSNRAMKANEINDFDLDDLGGCVQIECPIYIIEGDGCIVFKKPVDPDYIQKFTSDYYLESPFELGMELIKLTTPGIFCREMVERMDKNPYTMEDSIGWIPLTSSPIAAMRHLSKLFGGKKELWHFARAYCGLLTYLSEKHWMSDYVNIIKDTLIKFTKNYNVSEDLKASSNKIPLYKAFEYVLTNYSVCLRDRFYGDIITICKIVDYIKPEYSYPKNKIYSMASIIRSFDKLLRVFKQDEDMLKYVMEMDDYGHYIKYKGGVEGLISQLLWYDTNRNFKSYKLQMAIDKSFSDKRFGKAIKQAFNGEVWDESILECKLPEYDMTMTMKYDVWTDNGLDEFKCGYTGKVFSTSKEKLDHIKKYLGDYFYNGHKAVRNSIIELGKDASDKEIFIKSKERLYKQYGQQYKVLHTQGVKEKLLMFIKKFKELPVQTNSLENKFYTKNKSI